jgi:DNA repair exonuclease SbcCD ATPase subunit
MNLIRLPKLRLVNFGPFVGTHEIQFQQSGLALVKGDSGAGKSFLLKAISHLFGGCLDPGTELQSWYTEEPPEVSSVVETGTKTIEVRRRKGLTVGYGNSNVEPFKGKAAEAELDKIFGMDEKSRALVTYRGQGQPGLFLSLSDEKKKNFLGTLLGLEAYERIAKTAQDKASELELQLEKKKAQAEYENVQLSEAREKLKSAQLDFGELPTGVDKAIEEVKTHIVLTKETLSKTQKVMDDNKTRSSNLLEGILCNIRGKAKEVYQQTEPTTITALKSELEKQKTRLEKCKEHDAAEKLKVEKERSAYREKIKELRSTVVHRSRIENELKQSLSKVEILQSQKCSECKRSWDGEEHKASLKTQQDKIDACRKELEKIQEAEDLLGETECLLSALKDPEPHPVGKDISNRIVTINAEILAATSSFNATKKDKIASLEQEERELKKEFSDKLALELQDISKQAENLKNEIERSTNKLKQLEGIQTQIEIKRAVIEEREALAKRLTETYRSSLEEKGQLEKSFWLEKDVAALVGRQGFLGAIVEEVLVEIAAVANDILSQVANVKHLSIDFETEREAASSGNVVARIVPVIYSRGRRVSFSSGISGGQRTSIHLAVDLAIGEVVSNRRGSYPGFLILDEALDGLGGVAKESCLEMLKTHCKDRLILIVDHDTSFQGLFDTIIEVEMDDGQSRIVV